MVHARTNLKQSCGMNTYDTSHNRRRGRAVRQERGQARPQERSQERRQERGRERSQERSQLRRQERGQARRQERAHTRGRGRPVERRRSVGATAISASGARALGISRRDTQRAYGRGETVRRVEAARNEYNNDWVRARPAVYTDDARRVEKEPLLKRLLAGLSGFDSSRIGGSILSVPFVLLVALAIAIAMIVGPARTYYHAWRDAGRSKAEYEALAQQNEELNHEVERLQTLEGIEDAARTRGYVYPDEEALVMTGTEEEEIPDSQIVAEALEKHEGNLPWYVGCLDAVFGYEHD